MAVHDALHVGPLAVDLQVQERLAGPLLDSGELPARHVDQADVLGLEEALAMHRRRAKDFVLAYADGDIAVVGSREALGVNPPADLADVLFQFVEVGHSEICGMRSSECGIRKDRRSPELRRRRYRPASARAGTVGPLRRLR